MITVSSSLGGWVVECMMNRKLKQFYLIISSNGRGFYSNFLLQSIDFPLCYCVKLFETENKIILFFIKHNFSFRQLNMTHKCSTTTHTFTEQSDGRFAFSFLGHWHKVGGGGERWHDTNIITVIFHSYW